MKALIDAQNRAIEIISAAIAEIKSPEELRAELKVMKKSELIDFLMDSNRLQAQINKLLWNRRDVSIKDIAYDILCDPVCAWLSYDMIAAIMRERIPGCATSAKSLAWYSAKQAEHERDVCTRKTTKEITNLLLKG